MAAVFSLTALNNPLLTDTLKLGHSWTLSYALLQLDERRIDPMRKVPYTDPLSHPSAWQACVQLTTPHLILSARDDL